MDAASEAILTQLHQEKSGGDGSMREREEGKGERGERGGRAREGSEGGSKLLQSCTYHKRRVAVNPSPCCWCTSYTDELLGFIAGLFIIIL